MMMKFQVFYRNTPRFSMSTPEFQLREVYTEVATIAAEDLECVFRMMNVVDGSDFEMPRKLGVRSMCTGDIAVNESGEAFYCATAGWDPVDFK